MTSLGTKLLDFLLPPRCLNCGEGVQEQGNLCPSCWSKISFIQKPFCSCCGLPFSFETLEDLTCGGCLKDPPPFEICRSLWRYDEGSKPLILKFKHGDGTYMAPSLGRWLHNAFKEDFAQIDAVIPVPLHWTRLFKRQYNQAGLIARHLGLPVLWKGLARKKRTPPQGKLNTAERVINVKGAFSVPSPALVKGKKIALIDDVYTSGATLKECTKALLKEGADSVCIFTLARVVLPHKENN